MTIARVDGGQIIEFKELDLVDVPEHKRWLWMAVEYVGEGPIENLVMDNGKITITRTQPPPTVPQTVTRLQARLAMKRAGFLDLVVGKMALMNETDDARLYWDNAAVWERNSPVLLEMADVLQLSPMQLDQLFITAASIV